MYSAHPSMLLTLTAYFYGGLLDLNKKTEETLGEKRISCQLAFVSVQTKICFHIHAVRGKTLKNEDFSEVFAFNATRGQFAEITKDYLRDFSHHHTKLIAQ